MSKLEKSLRKVPAHVARDARAVIDRVAAGATVRELGGKRMKHDRTCVSVELGRSWRLVLDATGELTPVAVLSHENYSRGARPGKR